MRIQVFCFTLYRRVYNAMYTLACLKYFYWFKVLVIKMQAMHSKNFLLNVQTSVLFVNESKARYQRERKRERQRERKREREREIERVREKERCTSHISNNLTS